MKQRKKEKNSNFLVYQSVWVSHVRMQINMIHCDFFRACRVLDQANQSKQHLKIQHLEIRLIQTYFQHCWYPDTCEPLFKLSTYLNMSHVHLIRTNSLNFVHLIKFVKMWRKSRVKSLSTIIFAKHSCQLDSNYGLAAVSAS